MGGVLFAHQHKVGMNDAAICLWFTFDYSFFWFCFVLNSRGRAVMQSFPEISVFRQQKGRNK